MKKLFKACLILLICWTCSDLYAAQLYQIDVVVFLHQNTTNKIRPPLVQALPRNAVSLRTNGASKIYNLLPSNQSHLLNQIARLRHNYPIVLNYSWLQLARSNRPVAIDEITPEGSIKGYIMIRQSNYYLLSSDLIFTPSNKNSQPFIIKENQRLKPNTTYYLDTPAAGILIFCHATTDVVR